MTCTSQGHRMARPWRGQVACTRRGAAPERVRHLVRLGRGLPAQPCRSSSIVSAMRRPVPLSSLSKRTH